MKKSMLVRWAFVALAVAGGVALFAPMAMAQEEEAAAEEGGSNGLAGLGLGIGAGLAVGLAGLGTGLAQNGVGAGGTGAIAEKPELLANVLILFAIPETIVIFGLVIAFLLLQKV
ncbi:MAG: F0F1 ATP synthase subunit C [Candidatus Hydrogenedentota bacterium]